MTISTILIANRGEIAVRIVRAARDAGLRSVAVYADSDANSLHVQLADEAYALGGITPAETYLDIEKLIDIARRSGSDAIHPGYGFLAESAPFARTVIEAGITWIGPSPSTIELLGDKSRARALAARVGAPLAAGTGGPVSSVSEVFAFAEDAGLPIIIKAVHGGGGRGIRVVSQRQEIEEAYESAVREATAAFGRGECLVERFLERPRHLEVQILGDTHGRIAALGTRDCSLQRRNQKLVEEAPAPFLDPELNARIQRAASDICREVGYVSAGTVEFLLATDGTLSFLEVNTRLQVEHPVTEFVTGIDLVQEQFRIANGEPMRVPEQVTTFGHAIEFRINAEDPGLGFLPTPGELQRFDPPAGPGVRVDSGVISGDRISGSFDSLLAKLIVWGRDRDEALRRARRALAEFEIEGVATVLPFHRHVVEDPGFVGDEGGFTIHTRWIEEECGADFTVGSRSRISEEPHMVRTMVEIDGRRLELGLAGSFLDSFRMGVGQGSANGGSIRPESHTNVSDVTTASDPGAVVAAFAGSLSSWKAAEGADVLKGQTVAVLEAMKMEVPVLAPCSGVLHHLVDEGMAVSGGAVFGTVYS